MRKAAIIIVLVIAALIVIPQVVYTVDETQQAIVLQMGEYKYTVTEPGLHSKIPFIQSAKHLQKRVLVSDAVPTGYLTGGKEMEKKKIIVDHVTRWQIVEPLQFYTSVRTEIGARNRLQQIVVSELRDELAEHSLVEIISEERRPIMKSVASGTREKVQEFGIDVIDVRTKRMDLPEEVQASVFSRMRAERQKVAKEHRATGEEKALQIRATADKKRTIILAEAYEQAQKLKGEGDAEATRIYAEAFKKDPEFYAFMRSLQTYESSLASKSGKSTLVLGTDSELFKYLEGPRSKEIAAPEAEVSPEKKEKFTDFYILGPEGKAEGYPEELKAGEEGKLILGIQNHEQKEVSYRVEAKIDGEKVKIKLKGEEMGQIGPIDLKHDQKWEEEIAFLPQKPGKRQKVEFLLYKGDDLELSKSRHFRINVRE